MADLSIFSARLKRTCNMRDMSMDDLCAAMGNIVLKKAIFKYENGLLAPNSTVIIALSTAASLLHQDIERLHWNLILVY